MEKSVAQKGMFHSELFVELVGIIKDCVERDKAVLNLCYERGRVC